MDNSRPEKRPREAEIHQQVAQLAALREVGLELAGHGELDALLHSIVSRATALLGQKSGGLCLYQPDLDLLEWAIAIGTGPELIGTTLRRGQDLPGRVLETGQPFVLNDYDHPRGIVSWKACLGAPLLWGGECLGLLLVGAETAGAFSASDAALLALFATQAAAALENARLRTETERQIQEQVALRRAGAAISSSLDLETVLTRITEQLAELVDATSAYICSHDPETSTFTVLAEHYGADACAAEKVSDLGQSYPALDFVFMDAMTSGLPEISSLDDPDLLPADREHMHEYGGKTILYIPLHVKDRLLGFAELWESRQPRTFTPREIRLCQDIAQQAAIAMENARLYEQAQMEVRERRRAEDELQARNRDLALLNRVITATAAISTVEEALEVVCRELAQAFDLPLVAATMFDDDRARARVVAEYLVEGRPPSLGATFAIAGNAFYELLIEYKAPLVSEDALTDPRLARHHRLLQRRGTVSLLIVPIPIDGEVMGSLGLEAIQPRVFCPEEVNLAQRVAEQVSGSLARTLLIQKQQRLEAHLRQAHKMEALGHMAGGIAHDFNNLLTVVQISSQLLERKLGEEDPLWEPVRRIRAAAERAADLTSRLLSFSRREVVRPRCVDLNYSITSLRSSLKRISGQNVDLSLRLAEDVWPILVDPAQLDQLVVNLVVNAQAAMPEGGVLTIETRNVVLDQAYAAMNLDANPGDHVELAIGDTGHGMDEQVKAHLFEPFFTTKDRGSSTGLGLATVYGIITQNGGHIRVHSERGLGTTIRIYLPRAREAGEPVPLPPPTPTTCVGGTETILLAEDEESVLNLAAQILRDQGYQVLSARDGREALQISQHHEKPIDLLLTDVVMPYMNGKELADKLLARRPETRVLFMSGYTDNVIVRQGMLAPDIAFISKPLSLESLTRKVRSVLDMPGKDHDLAADA